MHTYDVSVLYRPRFTTILNKNHALEYVIGISRLILRIFSKFADSLERHTIWEEL